MKTTSSAIANKSNKSVNIIARYEIKKDGVLNGTVMYLVKNGSDKRYLTTLVDGLATACIQEENDELCEAGQYGHKCYHKQQCEQIEAGRKACADAHFFCKCNMYAHLAKVEQVAPVVEEVEGDMSVAERMIEEEVACYERNISDWRLSDLRMAVQRAGLSVTSRSKEPLIGALVQHRRETLLANVPATDSEMSPGCPVVVSPDAGFGFDVLPELPTIAEEVLSTEPLEEEFSEELAEQWTEQEIAAIRKAAAPKKSIEAEVIARDIAAAHIASIATRGNLNGNKVFSITR